MKSIFPLCNPRLNGGRRGGWGHSSLDLTFWLSLCLCFSQPLLGLTFQLCTGIEACQEGCSAGQLTEEMCRDPALHRFLFPLLKMGESRHWFGDTEEGTATESEDPKESIFFL